VADRRGGDSQHAGDFVDRQPGEVPQLDDAALPGVLGGETRQRFVDGQEVDVG
jgi:hypothetical protein